MNRRAPLPDIILAAVSAFFAPALLYVVGMAPLDRWLYPAASVAVGGYLYAKRSPWYIGFCIWLFCATPLIRRLADEQAGWDPSNPILLAPYLACAFTAFSFLNCIRQPQAARLTPFITMLACIGYGLILAMLDGRVLSGAVDAMKWSVGPLVATHILANSDRRREFHDVVVTSFLVAAPAMAAYGVFQYITPPPWDTDWMVGAAGLGLDSIGQPAPFALRVFSTMNSPGSFAIVLTTAILIALQMRRTVVAIPAVALMVLGLLLSQYRAIWAGTAVGALTLCLSAPVPTRLRVALAVGVLVVGVGGLSVVPEMQQTISERIDTLYQLGTDASGEDRLHQYADFLARSDSDVAFGEGLAINGGARRLDHRNVAIIDSGIITTLTAFGIFGGTIFLLGLIRAVSLAFGRTVRDLPETPLYRAVAIATFCQIPFGDVHIAESGFGAWLFVGLAAAATESCSRSAPELSPSPVLHRRPG